MSEFHFLLISAEYDFYLGRRELAFGKFFQLLLSFSHEENNWLTWGEIFDIDSDGNGIVSDYVRIRGYKIPIPIFLQFYLQKMLEDNPYFSWAQSFEAQNPDEDLSVHYGKRILEVNGYSDETIKDLKIYYKIRQNKDLYRFLGFSDKKEVQYNLSIVDLDYSLPPIANLKDKNFRRGYHFQSWASFVKTLLSNIDYMHQQQTRIRILLLLGLYSGGKPSDFLSMQWNYLFAFDSERKFIYLKKEIKLCGKQFVIPEKLNRILCNTLAISLIMAHRSGRMDVVVDSKGKYHEDFKTGHFGFDCKNVPEELLAKSIFITSKGNKIHPQNLSREINNSLKDMSILPHGSIKANSTQIMWGRRIIEIRGDHKATVKALMRHFKRKTVKELATFLFLIDENSGEIEFAGQKRKNISEEITYDIVPTNPFNNN